MVSGLCSSAAFCNSSDRLMAWLFFLACLFVLAELEGSWLPHGYETFTTHAGKRRHLLINKL
jgi:hypothetical protein